MKYDEKNTTLHIRLTPKGARNEIKGWVEDATGQPVLKVTVTAIPEKGRANKALIALLSKEWKIPKRSITIIRGTTDRYKTLLIQGLPKSHLPQES